MEFNISSNTVGCISDVAIASNTAFPLMVTVEVVVMFGRRKDVEVSVDTEEEYEVFVSWKIPANNKLFPIVIVLIVLLFIWMSVVELTCNRSRVCR